MVVWIIAITCYSTTFAAPDTGQPLPPGPDDGPVVIVPDGPPTGPGPCIAPRIPPETLYTIEGQLTERCNGNVSAIDNQPIDALVRIRARAWVCDSGIHPPEYTRDVVIASGQTDANGNFTMSYFAGDIYALISDNEITTMQIVRIRVLDSADDNVIGETHFIYADAGFNHHIDETFDNCLTNSTRIRILNDAGDSVFGAELFVNGVRHDETTDPNGFIYIVPPLAFGDLLVARARVHESKSKRGRHNQGSNQNWKYRVYTTSLPLEHDANGDNTAFRPDVVDDPNGTYNLVLDRDNVIIGLHLLLSAEWDASPTEMVTMFQQGARSASNYIFNATDGQFLIERIDVFDDKVNWDHADFRVYANLSLRAHVDWPGDGFWRSHDASLWRSSWMHMSRSNDSPVYVHEFGHFGFKLRDEYEGGECAEGVDDSSGPFSSNGGKASCVMFSQWEFTKFCSDHADNPHQTDTEQGDEDCWSEIKRHFEGNAPGPNGIDRWRIKTPTTRGAIVNRVSNIPVAAWLPVVSPNDANNEDLCTPVSFQWTGTDGAPIAGVRVFTRNQRGRTIVHGVTDSTGQIDPFQGANRTVTGLHIGDTIGATWTAFVGGQWRQFSKSKTFTQDDCTSATIVLSTVPGGEIEAEDRLMVLDVVEEPFDLAACLEPTENIGDVIIRVKTGVPLAEAPTVRLTIAGEASPRDISMVPGSAGETWIGTVAGLPDETDATIDVEAVDETGRRATATASASIAGAMPDDDSRIVSGDGILELEVPAGGFALPMPLVIGASIVALPNGLAGRVVCGPYGILSGAAPLSGSATLRLRLPYEDQAALQEAVSLEKLKVLRYDEAVQSWEEVVSAYDAGSLTIHAEIDALGAFVLIETDSVIPAGQLPSGGAINVGVDSRGDTDTDRDTTESSADRGAGACGSGAMFMAPITLALIGTRRRRR